VLPFDEAMAERLEVLYRKGDVVRRRQLVGAAIAARPGEQVLDLGCGPGFTTLDLLDAVGPTGGAVGVDVSDAMLGVAARRCAGHPGARFVPGDATALPVEDGRFDAALAVQVLEYVADVPAALAELHRALHPGGRLVVWDIDWPTLSWHSADPDRMARVLRSWDEHLTHPSLPSVLGAHLRAAGFTDVAVAAHAFASLDLDPDRFATVVLDLVHGYVGGRPEVAEADVEAWHAEQVALDAAGAFWFTVTQCCFTATKP
jgi:SAM-dependent methyltransferase